MFAVPVTTLEPKAESWFLKFYFNLAVSLSESVCYGLFKVSKSSICECQILSFDNDFCPWIKGQNHDPILVLPYSPHFQSFRCWCLSYSLKSLYLFLSLFLLEKLSGKLLEKWVNSYFKICCHKHNYVLYIMYVIYIAFGILTTCSHNLPLI